MTFDPEHKQIPVDLTEWLGGSITVDGGILPILAMIWAKGVRTYFSCQGGVFGGEPTDAYIVADLSQETNVRKAVEFHKRQIHMIEFDHVEEHIVVRFEPTQLRGG